MSTPGVQYEVVPEQPTTAANVLKLRSELPEKMFANFSLEASNLRSLTDQSPYHHGKNNNRDSYSRYSSTVMTEASTNR